MDNLKIHPLRNVLLVLLSISSFSCKKNLEIGPPDTQLTSQTIFENDATATAAQLGIYSQMEADGLAYKMIVYPGLSADEFTNYSTTSDVVDFYRNNLTAENSLILNIWSTLYKHIYQSNAVLEGVTKAKYLGEETRKQLIGEAKFIRAFCNFYLTNLFGKVPLVLSTNFEENAIKDRSEVTKVYDQIITDLNEAKLNLSTDFLGANNQLTLERVRPTRWAALALLARIYLYRGEWLLAEQVSTEVIAQNQKFTLVTDLNKVFLKNSTESIWQLMAVKNYTYPGGFLIFTTTPMSVALSNNLLTGFQTGDARKTSWTKSITTGGNTYYYPYKYKQGQSSTSVSEYTTILRLAELYLVRSESRARQGNLTGALSDLNTIRSRAGLSPVTAIQLPDILTLIQKERQAEFFAEFADRWLDLKRTGQINSVVGPIKGSDWSNTDQLYPVPHQEIIRNPFLDQNDGY